MHNTANVYLWGTHVGTVLLQDESPIAKFQYADAFLDMGVEVSPLRMPLSSSVFEFPDLPIKSFHGLPGLLSDSLPDKFGNKVIAAWLREQGKRPEDLNAVDRLCYAGRRGMGALEYKPALVDKEDTSERLTVDALSVARAGHQRIRLDSQGRFFRRRRARQGDHRVERGDGRGEIRTSRASRGIRLLAHQVRRAHGKRRQGRRRQMGLPAQRESR